MATRKHTDDETSSGTDVLGFSYMYTGPGDRVFAALTGFGIGVVQPQEVITVPIRVDSPLLIPANGPTRRAHAAADQSADDTSDAEQSADDTSKE